MITHSIIIQGGLGNQLFQIYALINYCIENNCSFILPYSMQSWDKNRHTYWDTLFNNLIDYVKPNKEVNVFKEYNESHFHYEKIPLFTTNTTLNGYFQTELYFKKHFEQICSMLNIREKQNTIKNKYIDCENTISLHFRMGDYGSLAHHPIIPDTYYINSLNYIIQTAENSNKNWNVYYCCEKEDDDKALNRINNIKQYFKNINFIKISNTMEDWEQLLFMSVCKYNIIANSSYSWWSAYFNTNKQKIVCYPSLWLGYAKAEHNLKDLHPLDWNKINI